MKNLLTIGMLCIGVSTFAQSVSSQVIASSGSYVSTSAASLSYTIGQPIAGDGSGSTLHQGFQVNLSSSTSLITGVGEQDLGIVIYPIPTHHYLRIESKEKSKSYRCQLVDSNGKVMVGDQKITDTGIELDLSNLAPSVYILLLYNATGKQKAISILKN